MGNLKSIIMDIRDFQLVGGLTIMLADISFRIYKLRNEEMIFFKKLLYKKYNWRSMIGIFDLPGWMWGALIFLIIFFRL